MSHGILATPQYSHRDPSEESETNIMTPVISGPVGSAGSISGWGPELPGIAAGSRRSPQITLIIPPDSMIALLAAEF